jgi:hypothetical protein
LFSVEWLRLQNYDLSAVRQVSRCLGGRYGS